MASTLLNKWICNGEASCPGATEIFRSIILEPILRNHSAKYWDGTNIWRSLKLGNQQADRGQSPVTLRCRPTNGKTDFRRWVTASEFLAPVPNGRT